VLNDSNTLINGNIMALLIPHKIYRSCVLHGFIKKTVTIYSVIDKCSWVWISPNSERCSFGNPELQNYTKVHGLFFRKYTLFLILRSVGLVRDYKKKYVNHLRVFVFRTPYVTVVWESSRVFFAVYLKSIIKYIKNIYFCTRFPNFRNVENGQNVFSRNLKLKIHTKFPR
jgi:hypothetical protein